MIHTCYDGGHILCHILVSPKHKICFPLVITVMYVSINVPYVVCSSLQFTLKHVTYKFYALWERTVLPIFLRKPLKNATLTLTLHCRQRKMNICQLGAAGLFVVTRIIMSDYWVLFSFCFLRKNKNSPPADRTSQRIKQLDRCYSVVCTTRHGEKPELCFHRILSVKITHREESCRSVQWNATQSLEEQTMPALQINTHLQRTLATVEHTSHC